MSVRWYDRAVNQCRDECYDLTISKEEKGQSEQRGYFMVMPHVVLPLCV